MATETMTVYAYGNVDALYGIFNAVAMVMKSDDFKDMIRVAIIIGFAVVATLAALPGNLSKSWNWFLAVTVLTGALLVPKADVSIVDKLGHQATRVVSDVPWTLGLLASVKSSVGATLTGMFETAFQTIPAASVALPAELSYQEHGMMFGSRLVQKSREAEALSVYAKFDLVQYIRNCIFPVQGASGSADAMENSTDLKSTYGGMNNKALSSSYHDGGVLKTDNCDAVWAAVSTKLNAAGAEAVKRAAQQALPDLYKTDSAVAVAKVEASLEAIYNRAALAGAAASASQIMQQNILINATAEASALYGASLNDPSTMLLASMRTQAVQQANAGNMVQGRIAEETLPIVRNITEGILYATFPLLCILLVASEAKALGAFFKSYVYVLIWVELWPPMFAVVNYLQTLEAAKTLGGAAYLAGGATGRRWLGHGPGDGAIRLPLSPPGVPAGRSPAPSVAAGSALRRG
jgi:conjugal transfer mating pair stabilization protein TraG